MQVFLLFRFWNKLQVLIVLLYAKFFHGMSFGFLIKGKCIKTH